jgi:hypothetical protein
MTLKVIPVDVASGKTLEVIDDVYGNPTLAVTDHYWNKTRFKSETRTGAGTSTIASPTTGGAIMLTDMIISTDKVANSQLTVFFDDATRQVNLYDGYANDAPINFAIGFRGGWTGWKDAALKMTTLAVIKATVAMGYIKTPEGVCYTEWDALR